MLEACRAELRSQQELVARLVEEQLRPALRDLGTPILDVGDLDPSQRDFLARYFVDSVEPILTPLAADAAHPFPFISNLGLNLAVLVTEPGRRSRRFVRIKVPANRPRWVPLPDHAGWVPLEQVIADNLSVLFPRAAELACSFFRVTRGAKDDPWTDQVGDEDVDLSPGAIIGMVTAELTARKYAGVVRLEVSADMPVGLRGWLATQLDADPADVIATPGLLSLGDLMELPVDGHAEQRDPPHEPVTHPRLRNLDRTDPSAVFDEIRRGDILVHLPYHSFDTSILRFLQSAAVDPAVLAIKLTIYRTGRRSPIIQALKEAARRGKQVAVLVEITARFDEAPNISWGKELEQAGAHVAYGVERVKTHVKLALVVREEPDGIRRYVHVGTGNYHEGTARLYEDLGLLSADPELAARRRGGLQRADRRHPGPDPGQAPGGAARPARAVHRTDPARGRARPCGTPLRHPSQDEPAPGPSDDPGALRGQPGRRPHRPQRPRPVLPAGGGPGAVTDDPGLQHPRQIPRAQPDLPLRERRRARVLHRLGRLDDTQPLPADGGCRPRLRSGHQGRAGEHPAHATRRTTARRGTCSPTASTSAGTRPRARPGGMPNRCSSSAPRRA